MASQYPSPSQGAASRYPEAACFPGGEWQRRAPDEVGLDPDGLDEAVRFAIASETRAPRDLVVNHYQTFGREPFGDAIGPVKARAAPNGLVIRHGRIAAEWGDPGSVDMAHSVTKSLLSSVVGAAVDQGLIRSVHDRVCGYMPPVQPYAPVPHGNKSDRLADAGLLFPFDSPHNRTVTWDSLLRQTSDWEGVLWGKPDWADRPEEDAAGWGTRPRHPPGTVYKYNDVRTNVLALAALNVWRRPLPQVLKECVMDPIGASGRWRWFGYENSWIVLDGLAVQSVTGGGHWGGGAYIDAYDMARFGYLTLRGGEWDGHQVLSRTWVDAARTPTGPEPTYGYMNWFLNTDQKRWPSAPATAFAHVGNGTNLVYVDPEHDLVAVVRWIDGEAVDGFLGRLLAAVRPG